MNASKLKKDYAEYKKKSMEGLFIMWEDNARRMAVNGKTAQREWKQALECQNSPGLWIGCCRLDDLPQTCSLSWYTGMQTIQI